MSAQLSETTSARTIPTTTLTTTLTPFWPQWTQRNDNHLSVCAKRMFDLNGFRDRGRLESIRATTLDLLLPWKLRTFWQRLRNSWQKGRSQIGGHTFESSLQQKFVFNHWLFCSTLLNMKTKYCKQFCNYHLTLTDQKNKNGTFAIIIAPTHHGRVYPSSKVPKSSKKAASRSTFNFNDINLWDCWCLTSSELSFPFYVKDLKYS